MTSRVQETDAILCMNPKGLFQKGFDIFFFLHFMSLVQLMLNIKFLKKNKYIVSPLSPALFDI